MATADAEKLDAVLPLKVEDLERSAILRVSLDRFFPDLGTCWVVTKDSEAETIARAFDDPRYRIVSETELMPELRRKRLYMAFHAVTNRSCVTGWYVQQLAKLAIADRIRSDHYLTLDADVICVRPVRTSDLVQGGRSKIGISPDDPYPEWYDWAARVLHMRHSRVVHCVTPAVVSKHGMLELQEHLRRRVGVALRGFARLAPDGSEARMLLGGWRSYLLRKIPWTEYTLYFTFLERSGNYDVYHFVSEDWSAGIYGNCAWMPADAERWDPAKSFESEHPFYFSVVQSNTDFPVEELWRRVAPYLGSPATSIPSPATASA